MNARMPLPLNFRARAVVKRMFAVLDCAYASQGLYSAPFWVVVRREFQVGLVVLAAHLEVRVVEMHSARHVAEARDIDDSCALVCSCQFGHKKVGE